MTIFDETAAQRMGLFPGQVVVQIHCGSRGFGHQICTDYVARFQRVIHQYGIRPARSRTGLRAAEQS